MRMVAPILCFTADEIWKAMPHRAGDDVRNVALNEMPGEQGSYRFDAAAQEKWARIIALRDTVNKALEEARNEKIIGKPLEAAVSITVSPADYAFFTGCSENFAALCIVSAVEFQEDGSAETPVCSVTHAAGEKCQRCWVYSGTVGQNAAHPTLCARCAGVIG